jgi:ATP-dependent RNA helicase MRH4
MQRLTSPRLHRLPSTLKTEQVSYGSTNTQSGAIERRVREVWAEDVREGKPESKILVFANRASKVAELAAFLESRGIASVALSGGSGARRHGSNAHLDGFLKPLKPTVESAGKAKAPRGDAPRVLITTSLLSRGLDFSPDVAHVFVADAPRNMVDFLHRAGRAGRAGNKGKVVLFAKEKGRGTEAGREVKRKVRAVV